MTGECHAHPAFGTCLHDLDAHVPGGFHWPRAKRAARARKSELLEDAASFGATDLA